MSVWDHNMSLKLKTKQTEDFKTPMVYGPHALHPISPLGPCSCHVEGRTFKHSECVCVTCLMSWDGQLKHNNLLGITKHYTVGDILRIYGKF